MKSESAQQPLAVIARMHSQFPSKFGIPRQSGLAKAATSTIVFEPAFRDPSALRGLDAFSHIWLIWGFSETQSQGWHPTVRPPLLGGNTRVGVFATRSPFRPNALGLSSVRLLGVHSHPQQGTVLQVGGADLMDGTPIYDIKPYLPYVDSHPAATGGFTDTAERAPLQVDIPPQWQQMIPTEQVAALCQVLALDPRPAYQQDDSRVYGIQFAGLEVRFTVQAGILSVCQVAPLQGS